MSRIKELKREIVFQKKEAKNEYLKKEELENERKIKKRLAPESWEDVAALYLELKKWKEAEIEKTKTNKDLSEDQKQEVYQLILAKEVELI